MLTKVLAASVLVLVLVLVLGMGTSAMAQSSDSDMWWWWHHDRAGSSERVDPYATGSMRSDASGLSTSGNPGPIGPCASDTPGPDANSGQNVNDSYCGK